MKMNGMKVIEMLLALGDGDTVVIDGCEWTSFESDGFQVEDLRGGGVERVARQEVVRRFDATKMHEVVR
jgi:hypothetical protein